MAGKGFSTNDFTDAFRQKLERLQNYNDEEIRNMIESFEMFVNNEFLKTNSNVSTNTLSIEALQTSIQNLQTKDEEHDTSIQTLQSKNEELKAENEAYKKQLPAGQESGEYITLTDSSDLAFDELRIFGNSRQEKRSGKNVFDKSQNSKIKGRAKQTEIENGVRVEMLQESNWGYVIYLLQDLSNYVGKTVRMKANYQTSSTNIGCYKIGLSDANASDGMREVKATAEASGDEISFVVPELTDKTYLTVWLYASNPVDDTQALTGDYVDYTNIIITIDNEDMTYEAFGAMPSLDFKSEVEAVEEVNIVVCNKNKLKLIDNELSVNGVSIKKENGKILLDGACTATNDMIKVGEFFAIEGKKYIMSINQKTEGWGINANSNSAGISTSFNIAKASEKLSGLVATATKTGLVSIYLAINKDISFDNFELAIQIEEDEVTELIANEQQNLTITAQQKMFEEDCFEKIDGVWKKKHTFGYVSTLNNQNITVAKSATSTETFFRYTVSLGAVDRKKGVLRKMHCTHFENVDSRWSVAEGICGWENTTAFCIATFNKNYDTAEKLKEFLQANNVEVWYELAEPVYLTCTEAQIEQLEAIEKAHGYKNITHIYCTDSLSANMQVTYRKDLETYINNKDKEQDDRLDAIEQLLSTTQTSALLLDNMQADLESEV